MPPRFDEAAERLQHIAADTTRPDRQATPRQTDGGYIEFRASRRYGKLRLIVSTAPRPEGDRPQLIAVKR